MNALVLIGGGTCSGKRTLAERVVVGLGEVNAVRLCLDSFYLPVRRHRDDDINFDHPDALDWPLLHDCVSKLVEGGLCDVPLYNYVSGLRDGYTAVLARPLVVLHGLWALWDDQLRSIADMALFLDTPADIRFARRIRRDVILNERGWDIEGVLDYYLRYTRPMYETFVKPSIERATAVLDGNREIDDIARQALDLIRDRRMSVRHASVGGWE